MRIFITLTMLLLISLSVLVIVAGRQGHVASKQDHGWHLFRQKVTNPENNVPPAPY